MAQREELLSLATITIASLLLIIFFQNHLLNLVSPNFIQDYLTIIAVAILGLGFTGFQEKNVELKKDLLDASIWMFVSLLFGLLYLSYNRPFFLDINFGKVSLWAFIGGFMYFFFIIIKERIRLI